MAVPRTVRNPLSLAFQRSFESNQSFNLTLVIESNIAPNQIPSQGGFRLLVSGGTIEFSNPNEAQELDGGWTHTGEGNSQRAWNFTWVAPQENTSTVEFIVFGNAVNGNGNSMGDAWNSYGVTIPGSSFDGTLIQPDVDQSYSLTDFSLIHWRAYRYPRLLLHCGKVISLQIRFADCVRHAIVYFHLHHEFAHF